MAANTAPRTGSKLTRRRQLAIQARAALSLYTTALKPYIDDPDLAERSLTAAVNAVTELSRVHEVSIREEASDERR